jgi:Bifunctional DNA primase/polymerase, N-terminal
MLAAHRLALALGVVGSDAVLGDDEASRKQLIRAGEAMVNAGLAVVLNRSGTKIPLCTLTAIERKKADQQARDAAAAAGDPMYDRRTHRCGLSHAITDLKTATRVLTRISKRERFNVGVEPRASRVCIVDLDTARQVAEFSLRCGRARPSLTVRSPGQRDAAGNWVHKDGGHIWFDVPEGMELPASEGIYTAAAGWTAIWGEHQVLVPPSAREEGAYVLVGSIHPMPEWLRDVIVSETQAKQERREEASRRRSLTGPSAIDDWSTETSWSTVMAPDGWIETGLVDTCGCPIYTAPGDHGSPKSATAHEPGCSVYVCERGHGPLHVWTDYPSDAVAAAITQYGTRTLTKIQVLTFTEGEGRMGRTLDHLGVEMPGPTVIRSPFGTWVEDPDPRTSPGSDDDPDENDSEEDELEEDEDPPAGTPTFSPEMEFERRVRREVEHELVRQTAQQRVAARDTAPLRVFGSGPLINAPRPEGIA